MAVAAIFVDDALCLDLSGVCAAEFDEVERNGHAFTSGTEDLDHWRVSFLALGASVESIAAHFQDGLAAQLTEALNVKAVILKALHLHHWDLVSLVEEVAGSTACDC